MELRELPNKTMFRLLEDRFGRTDILHILEGGALLADKTRRDERRYEKLFACRIMTRFGRRANIKGLPYYIIPGTALVEPFEPPKSN